MIIFWGLLYNTIVYPIIFIFANILSLFNKKIREGIAGRRVSLKELKEYFKLNGLNNELYWFHAASLGEFYQAKPVLEGLKEVEPNIKIILSFSSPSGYNNAESKSIDLKIYMPFDFIWSMRKALKIARPKKIIFASYDIWPNMIWLARARSIHLNIFAARVKDNSIKLRLGFISFYRSLYRSLTTIYTVADKDSKRIKKIIGNINNPKIKILGNPRYDMVMETADNFTSEHTRSVLSREKRIIIGSAHKEDDDFIIPALIDIINFDPNIKILYAPHEPVDSDIERIKLKFIDHGYSSTVHKKKKSLKLPEDQIVILGVVGLLSKLYWQGQIAFVGGGLSTGIHNVMEPAIARLPVLFGPKYQHAHEAEELLEFGGGFCVKDQGDFTRVILDLIKNEDNFTKVSLAATDVIHKNLGSSTRIIRNLIRD